MIIDTKNLSIKQMVEKKKEIIESKKQLPIFSESFSLKNLDHSSPAGMKTKALGDSDDPNKLKVSFIGNTAMFMDSHGDVLSIGSFDKTIRERGSLVPHLVDHQQNLAGKIGKTLKVYTEMVSVADFGIKSDVGVTQALMMDSELQKDWNPKIFQLYKDQEVNQHSIGMQYVKLELAVNDAEFKQEFELWNKIFPQIINKEKTTSRGFFWYVTEIKLFEISAVLFGANELTPTTSTGKSEDIDQPFIENTDQENDDSAVKKNTDEIEQRKRILLNHY